MSPTSYQTAPPRISIIATLGASVKQRANAECSRAVIGRIIDRTLCHRAHIEIGMPANRTQTSACVRTRLCLERSFGI